MRPRRWRTIPDLFNYWLTGEPAMPSSPTPRPRSSSMRDADVGDGAAGELDIPTRLLPPLVEPGTVLGAIEQDASRATLAGTPRRGARVPRHGVGRGRGRGRRPHRVSQLGHVVAARHRAGAPGDHAAGARAELHQRRRRVRHDAPAEEHRRPVAAAGVPSQLGRGRRTITPTTSC